MTEAIPLAITALIPIVMFPLFNIQNTGKHFHLFDLLVIKVQVISNQLLCTGFMLFVYSGEVCQNYMKESVMMFVGGISLALAIQYSNLHKRIALKILISIGTSPWKLLLGIMVTTFFLSCWIIINVAVAAMMIPIALGIIDSLEDKHVQQVEAGETGTGDVDLENDIVDDDDSKNQNQRHKKDMRKLFMLAIGFSANIGGASTMIGSNPSLIAKELLTA